MQIDLKTLETLGITKEDFIERIVSRAVEALLERQVIDEDGEPTAALTEAARTWDDMIRERLDAKVQEIGEQHIMPLVNAKVAGLVLQETNRWGEKTGKPLTLVEFMVARAEAYMLEGVDYNGSPKNERDSYGWRKYGTRIDYAIDSHLKHDINQAMEQVIADGNKALVGGLVETCKLKLGEIAGALKVEVKTK